MCHRETSKGGSLLASLPYALPENQLFTVELIFGGKSIEQLDFVTFFKFCSKSLRLRSNSVRKEKNIRESFSKFWRWKSISSFHQIRNMSPNPEQHNVLLVFNFFQWNMALPSYGYFIFKEWLDLMWCCQACFRRLWKLSYYHMVSSKFTKNNLPNFILGYMITSQSMLLYPFKALFIV